MKLYGRDWTRCELEARIGRIEQIGGIRRWRPCPHMILYHVNFGFPLMGEGTQIRFPEGEIEPRERCVSLEGLSSWQAPNALYRERVFYHRLQEKSMAAVQIVNPEFPTNDGFVPVQVTLSWPADTLPNLVHWRMPGAGMHVLGIEPANCRVEGRRSEREQGTLVMLEPGQIVRYELRLNVC